MSTCLITNLEDNVCMSAINNRHDKKSGKNTTVIIVGVIAIVAGLLFAYMLFYTAPVETTELVKIIAVTDDGCVAETMDGYAVNIGDCNAQPDQYVNALVDQKTKERAALMNPTN
jgi:hypothetical protein